MCVYIYIYLCVCMYTYSINTKIRSIPNLPPHSRPKKLLLISADLGSGPGMGR